MTSTQLVRSIQSVMFSYEHQRFLNFSELSYTQDPGFISDPGPRGGTTLSSPKVPEDQLHKT